MDVQTKRDKRDHEILEKLTVDGVVTPEAVIAAAKAKNHPWHKRFDWNDKTAAHKHRIDVARAIIRQVQVRIIRDDVIAFRPAYVSQPKTPTPTYRETKAVANQQDVAMAVLNDELARIKGSIERARSLATEFGLRGEFESLLSGIVVIERKLKLAA